jgi:citrate synthase
MGTDTESHSVLTVDGRSHELPVVTGVDGGKAVDISRLRQQAGLVVLDDGFANTASCLSSVSYVDGEQGILRFRGYPIEQLAEKSSFVETAYLLLRGELPTIAELDDFSQLLNASSLIHEDMHHFFDGFPRSAHPMGILSTMVASLSTFYHLPDQLTEEEEWQTCANLISQVRTIAAFSHKKSIGDPVIYPSFTLRYVENFLTMMFSSPVRNYELDPAIVRAVELFLLLHADHEQNCSTSTVRMVGSSLANVYAVVSAGISALWGPRHGGANQAVMAMLQSIHAAGGDGSEFVERAKRGDATARLAGFGHRIYKTHDPRARILKQQLHHLLEKPGRSSPLFDIALRLEDIAGRDEYFLERKLYPNVDFYSGLLLKAAGIPDSMFTVLFTIGRVPGWLAHWREMRHAEQSRIARPRQVYVGPPERALVPLAERG